MISIYMYIYQQARIDEPLYSTQSLQIIMTSEFEVFMFNSFCYLIFDKI